jgi:CheY-like chemotaxis protein
MFSIVPFHDKISYYPNDRICRDIHRKDGPGTMEPVGRDKDGRSGTVLLVEDSELVRDVVAFLLESDGLTVLQASGGEAALALVRRGDAPIDLLLTDIVMPEMSGVELADRLERERPDMRILFMTAYAEEVVVNEGILGKHRECIGKPFTQEQITKRVRKILFP